MASHCRRIRCSPATAVGWSSSPPFVAVSPDGYVERLSPETIAATDQVMQAAEAVRRALDAGPAATRLLCDEVAGRVDAPAIVAVVVERYDGVAWSARDRSPLDRRTVVACEARR
jgi:hypothetical protein